MKDSSLATVDRFCIVPAGKLTVQDLCVHVGALVVALDEEPYLAAEASEEYERLFELIDEMCREAGLRNRRESARGESYSIAENAIAEYTAWYHMPWEDY